jgi:hypothetical protein
MRQGSRDTREDGREWDGRTTIEVRPVRSCVPHGRRAWANRLLLASIAAGILLQSAWDGLERKIRRLAGGGRWEDPRGSNSVHQSQSICSVCQVLALCKPRAVPRAPATDFGRWSGAALPSLRAHKPILPRAIHQDQAGEILENLAPAARNNVKSLPGRAPQIHSRDSEPNGSEDALVHEPAHADIHCHAQRQERKQHRRPTVTH